MLDAWIIEKIKEREKVEEERPVLRLPVHENVPCQEDEKVVESEEERGVFIIHIGDSDEKDFKK